MIEKAGLQVQSGKLMEQDPCEHADAVVGLR